MNAPLPQSSSEKTREQFNQLWTEPSGFPGRLATVDNIRIGSQFLVTAFSFFFVAGAMALLMRVQLTVPENSFLGPEVYNRLFTMHGTTMMYLFAVPVMEGLAAILLPVMLGGRDLAYPRLTALSYWVYLASGLIFFSGFLFDQVADIGWFAYTPLSAPAFAAPVAIDFWLVGLGAAELAGIAAGSELTISILKLRAPGMSLARLPLFAWAWLATAVMIVFAFTTLFIATVLLELDHAISTQFFNANLGGNHLLWQHLFWFFGHPEVYIIFLPATGIISMIVTAFSGRIVGYTWIVIAILLTGFLSFGLWVHHMFTTGLPELSLYFFVGASLMIALASGTQIFAWIASLWGRRPKLSTPLLYVLGFIFIFVLGGLTGVMIAIVPFDWQVHDTFFLVAHFHYVLIGGAVFPLLAGVHYWTPKLTGRLPSETLGKWSFWLSFVGFNATFFPMHVMGLIGMPRRVYTYPAGLGLEGYNIVATVGSFVLALGFLLFFVNILRTLRTGDESGDNPWGADSLEWALGSVPPPQILYPRIPIISSRHPAWDKHDRAPVAAEHERIVELMDHRPTEFRATLLVNTITGVPEAIVRLATPSYMPLVVAVGIVIVTVAAIVRLYLLVSVGALISVVGLFVWLWPEPQEMEAMRRSTLPEETGLPLFTLGARSLGWLGLLFLMMVLGWALSTLLYTYFYLRLYSAEWPQGGLPALAWQMPALTYAALPGAAGLLAWAWHSCRRGNKGRCQIGLGAACVLGLLFLGLRWYNLAQLDFYPQTNAYGSIFYVLGWAADLIVMVGLSLAATACIRLGRMTDHWQTFIALHVQMAAHFWYFTAVVVALVFGTLYLSPHLL